MSMSRWTMNTRHGLIRAYAVVAATTGNSLCRGISLGRESATISCILDKVKKKKENHKNKLWNNAGNDVAWELLLLLQPSWSLSLPEKLGQFGHTLVRLLIASRVSARWGSVQDTPSLFCGHIVYIALALWFQPNTHTLKLETETDFEVPQVTRPAVDMNGYPLPSPLIIHSVSRLRQSSRMLMLQIMIMRRCLLRWAQTNRNCLTTTHTCGCRLVLMPYLCALPNHRHLHDFAVD